MGIPNYQYEPLTPPSSWTADEKRLLQRITDIFDDIYMKWGRLDSNHIAASGVKEKNIAPNAVTDSKIASVDAAKVNRLDVVSFEAVTARIQDLAADLITTNGFTAKWAEIASAAISHLRVKYSDTDEAIIRDGIGGAIYIDRLTSTSATFVAATMGELVVKGQDDKYYQITIQSDGTIGTSEVTVDAGEIAAGETSAGKKIVETELDVVALNAQNIKATSAIIGSIFTDALDAGKITAGEALIASATIPTLYTTSVEAIGNSLTFSANERITMIAEAAAGAQAVAENAASLILTPEQIKAEVFASTEYGTLSTAVTQTATGLSSVQTKQTEIDGRVQTIEESVVIDGSTITIGKSDVPVQNIINETGFSIKEVGGSELAYVREGKMGAQRLLLEDALIIGDAALKDAGDGHVLLLKYGG